MQFVNELINDRLETAFRTESEKSKVEIESPIEADTEDEGDIVTVPTEEELQAFYIVKGILAEVVDVNLIHYKDTTSYLSILFEGKVTKWVCRIMLKRSTKTIVFPNEICAEKITFKSINDLYKHKGLILESCRRFL